MSSFVDAEKRRWDLTLNVGLVGRLRKDAGVDLGKAGEGMAAALFADPESLVKALWVLCERQAERQDVTPEQFGYGFDGPSVQRAVDALLEAIIDFFHRSNPAGKMKEKLPSLLKKLEADATAKMEAQMDSILNANAGDSPASSASTPGK